MKKAKKAAKAPAKKVSTKTAKTSKTSKSAKKTPIVPKKEDKPLLPFKKSAAAIAEQGRGKTQALQRLLVLDGYKVVESIPAIPAAEHSVEMGEVLTAPAPVKQAETKPEIVAAQPVAAPAQVAPAATEGSTFIEKMTAGFIPKPGNGGRINYYDPTNPLRRLCVVDGKLYNIGELKPGWTLMLQQSGKCRVHSLKAGGAVVIYGQSEIVTQANSVIISSMSNCEIVDPAAHIDKSGAPAKPIEGVSNPNMFTFDGATYGKSPLVLAVIKKEFHNNPNITFAELNAKFDPAIMGRYGIVKPLTEAKALSGEKHSRYFFKAGQLLKIEGQPAAVCNQWTGDKIEKFIAAAKAAGHVIS